MPGAGFHDPPLQNATPPMTRERAIRAGFVCLGMAEAAVSTAGPMPGSMAPDATLPRHQLPRHQESERVAAFAIARLAAVDGRLRAFRRRRVPTERIRRQETGLIVAIYGGKVTDGNAYGISRLKHHGPNPSLARGSTHGQTCILSKVVDRALDAGGDHA